MGSGFSLYETIGDCTITSADGENTYRIRLAQEKESEHFYRFLPSQNDAVFPFYPKANAQLFLGMPRVQKVTPNALHPLPLNQLKIKRNDGQWVALQHQEYGNLRLRLQEAEGEVAFTKRLSILPRDFRLEFAENIVRVLSSVPLELRVQNTSVEIHKFTQHSELLFTGNENPAPEYFWLEVKAGQGGWVKLKVPFPASQTAFYGKEGQRLDQKAELALNDLYDCRLWLKNLSPHWKDFKVQFKLNAPSFDDDLVKSKLYKIPPFQVKGIPLTDVQGPVRQLLSATDNLDAFVELTCEGQSISLKDFLHRINMEGQSLRFELPSDLQAGKLEASAFRLDAPYIKGELPYTLSYKEELEGFEHPFEEGIWLIYPSKDSNIQFRPTAFNPNYGQGNPQIIQPGQHFERLHEVSILPSDFRTHYMQTVTQKMATDFDHPDWETVINQTKQLGSNLPLTTLDFWKQVLKDDQLLAMCFFKFGRQTIQKLDDENNILWATVPFAFWKEGLKCFESYYRKVSPDFVDVDEIITNKLEGLSEIKGLKAIADLLNPQDQQKQFSLELLMFVIESSLQGQGGQSGLLARNANSKWPRYYTEQIQIHFTKLPQDLRHLLPHPAQLQNFQKAIIYLPFVAAGINSGLLQPFDLSPYDKLKLQELIEFDEEWFYRVFEPVTAYFIQNLKP